MADEKRAVGVGQHLDPRALTDSVSEELTDRIWNRLEGNLAPRRPEFGGRRALAWSLSAASLTFVLGVGFGVKLSSPVVSVGVPLQAEPKLETRPAAALPTLEEERKRKPSVPSAPDELLPELPERNKGALVPRRGLGNRQPATPEEVVTAASSEPSPDSFEPEPEALPQKPPTWQRLANTGEYEAALFELSQGGGFEAEILDSNAEQLMLLADVARATGQRQRALAALRRIVSEFRTDPVAPLAAFSLGNLLEKAGDRRGAAQAFAVYRSLSPEGDFAEDALVREIRSAVERGDRDVARQLADQYRAGFPNGRHSEEIDRWLEEEPEAERATPEATDAGAPLADESASDDLTAELPSEGEPEPAPSE